MEPDNAIWRVPVEGGDEEVVVESASLVIRKLGCDGRGDLLRRPKAVFLRGEWVVQFLAFGRQPCDRGGTARASSRSWRARLQRVVRRPLDSLRAGAGRIRPDAGRRLPLRNRQARYTEHDRSRLGGA